MHRGNLGMNGIYIYKTKHFLNSYISDDLVKETEISKSEVISFWVLLC